ncbi:hypothetical protein CRENBAI_006993 [Crenichthys baileyi]|uniref:Uncharacterized protein n=1 Tax=Crenichthys baileyi TaxID=28760 RepID=A0AAV9RTV5_9TELE
MADSEEQQQVSSSTPLFSEGHHYQAEPEPKPQLEPGPKQDLFTPDDIVDLVGGAQDALERHRAEEESGLQESSVTSTEPEPVQEPEPEHVQVKEPEPEPEEKNVLEPEPQFEKAVPDSTSFSFVPVEAEVVAPRAEPESSELGPAPPVEPPAPQSDALHAAAAREAAPSPAEAAEQPAVTQEPVAPASCEYLRDKSVNSRAVMLLRPERILGGWCGDAAHLFCLDRMMCRSRPVKLTVKKLLRHILLLRQRGGGHLMFWLQSFPSISSSSRPTPVTPQNSSRGLVPLQGPGWSQICSCSSFLSSVLVLFEERMRCLFLRLMMVQRGGEQAPDPPGDGGRAWLEDPVFRTKGKY